MSTYLSDKNEKLNVFDHPFYEKKHPHQISQKQIRSPDLKNHQKISEVALVIKNVRFLIRFREIDLF